MSQTETLYIGDNAEVLRSLNTHSVDLVYLDPPFNKKKQWAAPIGGRSKAAEFKDTWDESDIKSDELQLILDSQPSLGALIELLGNVLDDSWKWYLVFMAVRLVEIHRILKPTGSVYLHCDPTMSHSLKLVLDFVFGKENFLGEIVWNKQNGVRATRRWGNEHDVILSYRHGKASYFAGSKIRKPYAAISSAMHFTHEDEDGRKYRLKDGKYKYYLDEGRAIGNIWNDISSMTANSPILKESTSYPTQKPLALLDRIIKASSREGDVILDPFCGCATACIAAAQLGRKWIGIDISEAAEERMQERMTAPRQKALLENWAQTTIWRVDERGLPERILAPNTDAPFAKTTANKAKLNVMQGGKCRFYDICGNDVGANRDVDRIIPGKRGGQYVWDNVQLLCRDCNVAKDPRTMQETQRNLREVLLRRNLADLNARQQKRRDSRAQKVD